LVSDQLEEGKEGMRPPQDNRRRKIHGGISIPPQGVRKPIRKERRGKDYVAATLEGREKEIHRTRGDRSSHFSLKQQRESNAILGFPPFLEDQGNLARPCISRQKAKRERKKNKLIGCLRMKKKKKDWMAYLCSEGAVMKKKRLKGAIAREWTGRRR